MNQHVSTRIVKILLILPVMAFWSTAGCGEPDTQTLYNSYCIACHGAQMDQGMGGSLVDTQWKHAQTDEEIANVIRNGISDKGMMPFGKVLTEAQITDLVALIRSRAQATQE